MQFFLPYLLRWCYIILDNFHSCFMSHMLSRMRYSKSINPSIGVILVKISPKSRLEGMLLIVVLTNDPSSPVILSVKKFFISLVLSIKSMVSISGRLSPHSLEMFSISPLQAYSFRCWFSNNSVITFLEGCLPSSFVTEVGIFFSILLFQ